MVMSLSFPVMIDCKLKRHPCRKAGLCKIPEIFSGDLSLRKQDKQKQATLAPKPAYFWLFVKIKMAEGILNRVLDIYYFNYIFLTITRCDEFKPSYKNSKYL